MFLKERSSKPRLRGVFHAIGALVAVPAIALCIHHAVSRAGAISASIYGISVVFLLVASATYHIPDWKPIPRMWLRRVDHTAIFFLIAGTYTPFCMTSLPTGGDRLLIIVWSLAGAGAIQSMVWPRAPRWLNVTLYVAMGWVIIPYRDEFLSQLTTISIALIAIGGALYTLGALVYALRWPNPKPTKFGYHEIFHVLVLAALACHFAAVWQLVS